MVAGPVHLDQAEVGGRARIRKEWPLPAASLLRGTGSRPEFHIQGQGDEIQIYQARADTVGFEATYVDSILYLQRLDWKYQGRGAVASGRVPMRLTTNPSQVGLLPSPLWIEVEIPRRASISP